jgi:hypothetical protein
MMDEEKRDWSSVLEAILAINDKLLEKIKFLEEELVVRRRNAQALYDMPPGARLVHSLNDKWYVVRRFRSKMVDTKWKIRATPEEALAEMGSLEAKPKYE